ncbi:TRIM33 [Mytilus coruscus]|uniref:TRIM33 n=1 Tax=Mytilus coruscus TaxID=42192 RepID=A0A6J8AUI6_MYTCO|nr:TRIM33 [Mytilus coruscus]
MATNEVCAGCLRDNEEEIAVLWCNDCEELVCRPCSKVHRRFAIPHDVVDIKHIPDVNKALSKICKDHTGQKLFFFCVNHDKIVCPACLSELHKECNINHIEKAAKGIKDSSAIHDLKERIHNQKGVIEKVKEEYNELSSQIGQDKEQQHERLKQLRSTIEDRLNQLDKNIETHYNQSVEKISSSTEQLKSLARTTQANLQDIEKADTEESEVKLFHLVKHLDTSQLSDEENLQCLENEISSLSIQKIPENIIEKVDAMFYEFSHDTQTTSCKGQQSGNKARQSQLRIHSDEKQPLHKSRTFYADVSSTFHACCFIDENTILIIEEQLIDMSKKLNLQIIELKDGQALSFMVLKGYHGTCYDTICTFDRNNALIVGQWCVFVIDMELKKVARTIKIGNKLSCCKWVTCIESQIMILCEHSMCHFISWIDYNGKSLRTLDLPYGVFDLDINDKIVYCTFSNANHVTYTTFSGVNNTCYTSLDLRERCKIAVGDSMIFLLERDRNSVYKVDITTKQRSVFLKDEITNPTHMSFDRKSKQLAVTCDEGKCLKIFNTCF